MAKKLNKLDLLKLSTIDTASNDFVAFAAKSDGLYQKLGEVESKLATTDELLDKVKTDVPRGAVFTDTVYTHPAKHEPSEINTNASNRFVTDAEKSKWNSAHGWGDHASAGYIKSYVNTTYSAGAGLTLDGTQFSLPITVSGSGTFVKSVTQGTSGVSVVLGTPPNTNTTYSAMSIAEGEAGEATSSRTVRADYLKQIIQHYDTNSVTGIRAGASGTNTNSALSNPYIKVLDDTEYRSQIRLLGSGATTVKSDASGNVTISSTNTVYTHPTTTARASGLYKITVNTLGHVTGATAVVQDDILALGISKEGPQGPRGYTGDKGDKPSHGWSGTSLRFENPNGTWGDYVNLKGATGSNGVNATITGATASKLDAGEDPTVTLGGTASARTFAFGIPKGDKGDKGDRGANGTNATITGATATKLDAGATPTVTLGGTASARTFAFGIPEGAKGATGARGAAGSNGFTWRPSVNTDGDLSWTNNGSTSTPTSINIKGPRGATGANGSNGTNATITGATATKLDAGEDPTVTLGGTASARTFAFGIPKGDKGDKGANGTNGTNGSNGFTWRPYVNSSGVLSWTNNSSTTTPTSVTIKGDPGAPGAKGADGLTTSIKVNGSTYTQSSGVISLPNYVPTSGGTFTGSITATKMFRSSDIRLKDNMCPIDTSKIDDIKLIEFNWKSDNKKDYGVKAQEVEKLYPELISTNTDGMKSVNYESLYAIKIARLEGRIKELENKLWRMN